MTRGAAAEPAMPGHDPVAFDAHDHSQCVETAIVSAETHCAAKGLRFTPVRRAALEILLSGHRSMGAYELLERLHQAGFGAQPPVAYRALDFLVANGFVHKIERLNAFVACARPGENHSPAFLICRLCEAVAEAQSAPARGSLGEAAKATGFQIERTVVEALGVCPSCAGKSAEKADA
jgi:Fur family zinc uptake transcriptional regulator